METIIFDEWGSSRTLQLTESEAHVLGSHERIFRVHPIGKKRYRVSTRGGFVGACEFSKNRQVLIQPKVPIENFYQLLWLGHRLSSLPSLSDRARFASGSASDWFAFLVLCEIETLLRGQLRNGYVETEEALAFVRGRIDFARPNFASVKAYCTYSDFQIDTPINQLIKGALYLLIDNRSHLDITLKARRLLSLLADVSYVEPSSRFANSVDINSTHDAYKNAVDLIKLLYSGTGLDFAAGSATAPALFVSMDKIFERAIYAALCDEFGTSLVRYQPDIGDNIRHIDGHPAKRIAMKPDVVGVTRPTAVITENRGHANFVVDAKYRRPMEQNRSTLTFRNSNIYQIMAYASALRCRGILVYPQVDSEIRVTYQMNGAEFMIQTVDLSLPNLEGLRKFAATCRH